MDWWVADLMARNPALLVSWVVWVIGSIVLHELAHGWAAIHRGDTTPIELGHMTWNPLVHMGGMSLLMFALVGIAWGAMPVNPSRLRGRHAESAVAAAGPTMNLGLAVVAIVCSALWMGYAGGVGDPVYTNVLAFFEIGAFLNLILMGFNLLPVPPLDGSRIVADFSPRYRELIESPNAAMVSMLIFLFVFFTAFDRIAGPAQDLRDWGQSKVLSVLPGVSPPGARSTLTPEEEQALRDLGIDPVWLEDEDGFSQAQLDEVIRQLERRLQETGGTPPEEERP